MSAKKAALKAAKAAIDRHNYDDAAKEAQKVLSADPKHYHANIFLGLALEKQDRFDEAESVYTTAVKQKDDDPLVWQGLIGLYEKQANKKIDEYSAAALRLGELWMQADDKYKCQSVVDRFVGFVKQHGSKLQYRHALELMLPTSRLYDYLEGRLPHPSQTYPKIAEIMEVDEKQRINKVIGERRTRLGAKIGQVTTDVKREIYEDSPLEEIYSQVINWTNEDDTRRLYEEKLLQRAYDTLAVLPEGQKEVKRAQVQNLAGGLVILKHAFLLAWKITLEWKDVEHIKEIDKSLLFDYIELFPADGLTKILKGFLDSEISPFSRPGPTANDTVHDEDPSMPISGEDRLIMMTEGLEESSRSILSQRLMGEYFLHLEEYGSVVETAKILKELLQLEKGVTGFSFQNSFDATNIVLGTALVHYQSPRHHAEARKFFEDILARKSSSVSALIGVGLILEEEEEYGKASEFLDRALKDTPSVRVQAEAAWCRALSGAYTEGLPELEECLIRLNAQDPTDKDLKGQVLYRIGMCLWNIDTSKSARRDRNGAYARFIGSLQANQNYAPSYTSLGIYYSDYSKDKKRARKCFHKAFELSSSEVAAAERLARSFADQGDWDFVEVVSQRVVDSGKVRPSPGSKKKGLGWPFAALGVCQLNSQEYAKSVHSFQSALRTSPTDFNSWVGLGESYHNSGRYIAATKAFEQAQKLQGADDNLEDTWFSKYMLANVRRELGEYGEAVEGYESVLALKPMEFGVTVALLQTHVESAWQSVELGLFGRAASSAAQAITAARGIISIRSDAFNVWKALGDACSLFSWFAVYAEKLPADDLKAALMTGHTDDQYNALASIDLVGPDITQSLPENESSLSLSLRASILAHKRALHCCANDIHAQAVAWYNLGWAENRAHVCLPVLLEEPRKNRLNHHLKASVRCFKRAIELEAGNSEFWNALAIVTTPLNPKVAQHAFVRSLYLSDKSAKVWTNLGAFYLLQSDAELANHAFMRGQSADPDFAHAWLGQGILALLTGNRKEAQSLFTHAFEISDSSSSAAKRLYGSSTFDQLLSSPSAAGDMAALLQPLFALHQLKAQEPESVVFRHIYALFSERVGGSSESIKALTMVCEEVEAEYEASEASQALAHFSQAKADLARAYLASGNFDEASENADTALDLSADDDSGLSAGSRRKFRLSAHLTSGLAAHYIGNMDKAISMFRTALEESEGSPDIVCVLAQVLWAKGGEQERTVAREQLFDCIEHHPEHKGAIMLLAVIAMLDDDQDTLKAVAADLQTLRARRDLDEHQNLKIGKLLGSIAMLNHSPAERESLNLVEAAMAVMLMPYQPHGWNQLADLANNHEAYPADMALLTGLRAVPPSGTLEAEDLGKVLAGTCRPADAQRAAMVAPWVAAGWEAIRT